VAPLDAGKEVISHPLRLDSDPSLMEDFGLSDLAELAFYYADGLTVTFSLCDNDRMATKPSRPLFT